MKLIKNLAAALLLASVLSVNVYAGDQQIPGITSNPPQPPPPATSPVDETCKTEETQTTETQEPTLADEFWVDALMYMLSLY